MNTAQRTPSAAHISAFDQEMSGHREDRGAMKFHHTRKFRDGTTYYVDRDAHMLE